MDLSGSGVTGPIDPIRMPAQAGHVPGQGPMGLPHWGIDAVHSTNGHSASPGMQDWKLLNDFNENLMYLWHFKKVEILHFTLLS